MFLKGNTEENWILTNYDIYKYAIHLPKWDILFNLALFSNIVKENTTK